MFRSVLVRRCRHLLAIVAQDDFGIVAPSCRRVFAIQIRQIVDQTRYKVYNLFGDTSVVGDQPNRRVVAMFGLTDEVGGNDHRVRRVVGEDQAVRRPGDHVDPDAAEQHAFCLGDELVTGADKDVGLGQSEQAKSHRGHALNAAHRHDAIGPTNMGGIDDGRRYADAGNRRRAGDDMLTAGNLGRRHSHNGAGNVAVAPARHIAAGGIDRDRLLAGNQAGYDFGFEVGHGCLLGLGEFLDVGMTEFDVTPQPFRHFGRRLFDSLGRQDDVTLVLVELRRVLQRRRFAPGFDIVQNFADDLLGFRCVAGGVKRRLF